MCWPVQSDLDLQAHRGIVRPHCLSYGLCLCGWTTLVSDDVLLVGEVVPADHLLDVQSV